VRVRGRASDSWRRRVADAHGGVARPGVPVAALLSSGFTDCHFFRDQGIPCYGFMPSRLNFAELATFHGNNERLSVTNVGHGRQFMLEFVRGLATQ